MVARRSLSGAPCRPGAALGLPERELRPMDAGTTPVPSWLPWLGRVGRVGARAILLNLGRSIRFWTRGPIGDAPPPLPGLSDPRFERIEGTVEGTGLCQSKRCSPRLQLTTDTAEASSA